MTIYVETGGLVGQSELQTADFLLGQATGLRGTGVEVTYKLKSEKSEATRGWEFELGLGYEYQTGFESGVAGLDLHGAAQVIPSIAVYAIRIGKKKPEPDYQPYIGVRTGFMQLMNVRGYDDQARQYALDGLTYQLGAALGVWHKTGWIIELNGQVRSFRSIDYKFPAGVTAVPVDWPRQLSLSSVTIAVGYQLFRKGS